MTQLSESVSSRRAVSERALADAFPDRVTPPSMQDVFLNSARRDRLSVTLHLMNGQTLEARIKGFDRFAVVVDVEGADHLVFKHAIASIETSRSVANYFAAPHP
jgi:host factor-I protein